MHYPFVKPEDENTSGSRKRRAARIVNGINCAPFDQAYARDYLWVLLQYPILHSAIETCLGPEVLGNGFLSSGQWGQGYNEFSIYLLKIFYLISLHPTKNVFKMIAPCTMKQIRRVT